MCILPWSLCARYVHTVTLFELRAALVSRVIILNDANGILYYFTYARRKISIFFTYEGTDFTYQMYLVL